MQFKLLWKQVELMCYTALAIVFHLTYEFKI